MARVIQTAQQMRGKQIPQIDRKKAQATKLKSKPNGKK